MVAVRSKTRSESIYLSIGVAARRLQSRLVSRSAVGERAGRTRHDRRRPNRFVQCPLPGDAGLGGLERFFALPFLLPQLWRGADRRLCFFCFFLHAPPPPRPASLFAFFP